MKKRRTAHSHRSQTPPTVSGNVWRRVRAFHYQKLDHMIRFQNNCCLIRQAHKLLESVGVAGVAIITISSIGAPAIAVATEPPITATAFSPSGTDLLLGSQAGLKAFAWPRGEGANGKALDSEIEHIHHISFSPDGGTMLVAGGSPARHGSVELWNWPQRSMRVRASIGDDVIYQTVWIPDSSKFITASADGRCRVVNATSANESLIYEEHSRAVLGIDLIASGANAVSVGVDQTLRLWNTATGQHLRTLDNHLDTIHGVIALKNLASPHPIVVTFGGDNTVRLWQPTIGRMMRFIKLSSTPLCGAASRDGKQLYVGCRDGNVRSIAIETMTLIADRPTKLDTIFGIEITPNNEQIFASGIGGVDWFVIDPM